MSGQDTNSESNPPASKTGGHSPGARFCQSGRHYVIVDERLLPHVIEGEYVIDSVYVPGHGSLCVCVETGELVRLNRHRTLDDHEWDVKGGQPNAKGWPSEEERDADAPVMGAVLRTLGARRRR